MTRIAAVVGIAAVVLAAMTAIGGRQVGALTAQAAEMKAEEVRWRGGFACEGVYERSDVVFHEGSAYIATEPLDHCVTPPKPPWELMAAGGEPGAVGTAGSRGAAGPAGALGVFRSPDGRFEVSVTNTGIELIGPDASVEVTQAGVKVIGHQNVLIDGGATTNVRASANLAVDTHLVTLGAGSCPQVARKDLSLVQGSFEMVGGGPNLPPSPNGPMQGGFILNGSSQVRAC